VNIDTTMSDFPDARIVASAAQVEQAYARIAAGLQPWVVAGDCVLLGIMIGGMIPTARIAGLLTGDFVMEYCQVSRYRGEVRGGDLEWLQAPRVDLMGRTVLLVDDIFDEGITLDFVSRACLELGAAKVVSAVLVQKLHDRVAVDSKPDLVGLTVADRYVFGAGMDYQHRWRHLPSIYALREGQ
jgi:hypoxanthine phosphoribosyltransferase